MFEEKGQGERWAMDFFVCVLVEKISAQTGQWIALLCKQPKWLRSKL